MVGTKTGGRAAGLGLVTTLALASVFLAGNGEARAGATSADGRTNVLVSAADGRNRQLRLDIERVAEGHLRIAGKRRLYFSLKTRRPWRARSLMSCDGITFSFPSARRYISIRVRHGLSARLLKGGRVVATPRIVRPTRRQIVVALRADLLGGDGAHTPWLAATASAAGCHGQAIILDFAPDRGMLTASGERRR